MSERTLSSLEYYDELRKTAANVERPSGSNVDVYHQQDNVVVHCHMSYFTFFTGPLSYDSFVAAARAMNDLNSGNGTFVPAVEGLNERCPIRFSMEVSDTGFSSGQALSNVIKQMSRAPGVERLPCAFIGGALSSVSVPTSMATGWLGYPQVSAVSTSAELDDKTNHPLFGRTVPADDDTAIPVVLFFRNVLNIRNVVVLNNNDSYGNDYAEGLRKAALEHTPDLNILQIPVDIRGDSTPNSFEVQSAVRRVKESQHRYIFSLLFLDDWERFSSAAYEQGILGDGLHVWIGPRIFPRPIPTPINGTDPFFFNKKRGNC